MAPEHVGSLGPEITSQVMNLNSGFWQIWQFDHNINYQSQLSKHPTRSEGSRFFTWGAPASFKILKKQDSPAMKSRVANYEILDICAKAEVLQRGPPSEEFRIMFASPVWEGHLLEPASMPLKQTPDRTLFY